MRALLLTFLLLLPAAARAQIIHLRSSGLTLETLAWGFDPTSPTMPGEMYAPVAATVSSGATAVQGILTLEYPQDASQNARIVAPFATTPNAPTTVQLLACLPRNCQWVKVTLSDATGASRYVEYQGIVGEDALPGITSAPGCSIAIIKGAEVFTTIALNKGPANAYTGYPTPDPPTSRWWEGANAVTVSTLPDAWIAWESFDIVVAREHDILQSTTAQREALHTWVEAGGRLVIIASQAGPRTLEAVPGDARECFTIDEPLERAPGAAVQRAMLASSAATTAIEPAVTPVRLLQLTPEGRRAGWTLRFPITDAQDFDSALLASGPACLGIVTIVGMNPKRICGIDAPAHDSLWREILFPSVPHWHAGAVGRNAWYSWQSASGPDMATGMAIRQTLDSITTTPSIGAGFFIVTLVVVGLLGLLIGPVGRVVLKRRGWLSTSWLAAGACIAGVSVAGWLIPALLRSGETAASRACAVDALCDERGAIAAAWSANITGFFAGRPRATALPASQDTDALPGGAWWRGISTIEAHNATGSRQSPLTLVTVPGGAGQRPGFLAQPLDFGQWTYRAFLDQRAAPPRELANLTLSLARDADAFTLTVRGLPEGAKVESGSLLLPNAQVALTPLQGGAATADRAAVLLRGEQSTPRERLDRFTDQERQWNDSGQYGAPTRLIAENASLPLQRHRNAALEQRIDAGAVCVRLRITGLALPWDSSRWSPATTRHEVSLRALLPASTIRGYSPSQEPTP
jgi:hypothetical protein